MRVIIAGGRFFDDYDLLEKKCDKILSKIKEEIIIVSGKQVTILPNGTKVGADYFGEQYAKKRGYPVDPYPANWDAYGKSAGPIRNREMSENADALILFWNGRSKGSTNILKNARLRGLKIRIIYY